jgi:hypothetical protein
VVGVRQGTASQRQQNTDKRKPMCARDKHTS